MYLSAPHPHICDGLAEAKLRCEALHDSSKSRMYTGPELLHNESLWLPPTSSVNVTNSGTGAPGAAAAASYDSHKPQTPPPDLPSLLLDSRIVYLGMPVRQFDVGFDWLTYRAILWLLFLYYVCVNSLFFLVFFLHSWYQQ